MRLQAVLPDGQQAAHLQRPKRAWLLARGVERGLSGWPPAIWSVLNVYEEAGNGVQETCYGRGTGLLQDVAAFVFEGTASRMKAAFQIAGREAGRPCLQWTEALQASLCCWRSIEHRHCDCTCTCEWCRGQRSTRVR